MNKLTDVDWNTWEARDRATLLFVIRDGQVLLIHKKRGLGKGKINGPGGRIDPGETPEQAAVRECQEELCITPKNVEYCGRHKFQFVDGYSIHVWVYRAGEYDGTPTETDEAIPLWFELDQVPYEKMWEDDKFWLPLVFDRQQFSTRWIFDDDKMLDQHIELVGVA